jgi:hypothetical protein
MLIVGRLGFHASHRENAVQSKNVGECMYPQAESISSDLISYLRDLYDTALGEVVACNRDANNLNGYTKHAIPAYIVAVAAIEAFMNEMFVSPAGRSFCKNVPENAAFWESLEGARLVDKLVFIPQLFFGQTFEVGRQPYQDMKKLVALRNELVHYKMGFKQPSCIKDLQQRRIALVEEGNNWTRNVSTLEGMRWAHNTICATIRELSSFATQAAHPVLVCLSGHKFYESWSESFVKQKAKKVLTNCDE